MKSKTQVLPLRAIFALVIGVVFSLTLQYMQERLLFFRLTDLGFLLLTGAIVFWCYPHLFGQTPRDRQWIGLFSSLFALSTAFGHSLQRWDSLAPTAAALIGSLTVTVSLTILVFIVLSGLNGYLLVHNQTRNVPLPIPKHHRFWLFFVLLSLCWLPVYLAFYPGVYAYDVTNQAEQCYTNQYNTHHPLLHTLLLKTAFMVGNALGSINFGIGLFSLLQLLAVTAGLAYGLSYLYTTGVSRTLVFVISLYFALLPVFSIMSISITKDTLFSLTFLLSLLTLLRCIAQRTQHMPWRKSAIMFSIFVFVATLLRNNASYAYILGFVVGMLLLPRAVERRVLLLGLAIVLLSFGGSALLKTACNATASTSVYEALSIPAQQLRRAQRDTPDAADLNAIRYCFLESVAPADGYIPTFADIARFSLNTRVYGWFDPTMDSAVAPEYILKTWLSLAPKYPLQYIEAFLQTNRGSWYINDLSHANIYGQIGSGMGYLMTRVVDTAAWYTVTRNSLLPKLYQVVSALVSDNQYQNIPILSALMNTGFQMWLFFLSMLVCILRRKRILFVVCLIPFSLWLTILWGPCTLVRYIYPYFLLNPLLLALALQCPNVCSQSTSQHNLTK